MSAHERRWTRTPAADRGTQGRARGWCGMSADAAHQEIHRLCAGGDWRMRMPVDTEHDSDMILTTALDELVAERDRARDLAVALEQQVAAVEVFLAAWPEGDHDHPVCADCHTQSLIGMLRDALEAAP